MHLPAMDMPEFWIDDALGQFIVQFEGFPLRHAFYPFALALAHIEAFASGVRVSPDHWMRHRRLLAT